MKAVFSENEYVRYASNGICRIKEIVSQMFFESETPVEYYVLAPVSSETSVIYVPVNNEKLTGKMSRLISKAELEDLIRSSTENEIQWIDDRKQRGEVFHQILNRCQAQELLKLIRCIYLKKCELIRAGKKLSSSDEAVLRQAESYVQKDFSFVLKISKEQVGAYIRKILSNTAESNE